MSVYLTAVLTAKSGSAETLKALLQDLVVYAKKEEACLQYELYQSAEDEIYLGAGSAQWQPYIQDSNSPH
jgi:quinol monooxygenase YgiN